jgi:predicted alpha-1,2-mannosidase
VTAQLSTAQQATPAPVDAVNVMIGTAAEGQTYPAAGVPFAMTQWTPQTQAGETKCVPPYYAADKKIQGFRGSHFLSGSCTQDYGSFTLMPLAGDTALAPAARASTFTRASEKASPYRYAVDLSDSGIHAEITGSQRAGMMRFRFAPTQKAGWVAVDNNVRLGTGKLHIDPQRQEITGENPVYRIYAGAGQAAGFAGYVVVQFDRPFTVGGTYTGSTAHPGSMDQDSGSGAPGAYVRFDLAAGRTVQARIGTSFVSVDEARRNLHGEMPDWDFDAAVGRAHAAWAQALDSIQVAGNSANSTDRRIFYTALYHAMQLPRIFSDASGSYPSFAGGGAIETAKGFTYYDDYSVWDTFRAVHPLFTILQPQRDTDMVKSLLAKGEQGGFLPIFPAWNSYTTEMTGDHATAIIADAYVKGIRGFDAEAAYRLMKKNATQEPATMAAYRDGQGRRALESYLRYGYIPLEDHVPNAFHADEQVSRTLDYAFDDFEVATMAKALGHADDAAVFTQRAQNYRNVIDPAVGFARGRHADRSWVTPFDPEAKASYITEATPYINTFFVPQDIPGMIDLLGGRTQFIAKLDGLFSSGSYDHGNEPSHHITYLYDDAGAAWKTQLHVHRIMSMLYKDSDAGLAGNDDAGQMSAWYVFSALGFYPVTPGLPRYSIGTPRFDDVTVNVGAGKTLRIRAKGAEAGRFYVRSVRLNGTILDRTRLLHDELVAGGDLVFEMSDRPDTAPGNP